MMGIFHKLTNVHATQCTLSILCLSDIAECFFHNINSNLQTDYKLWRSGYIIIFNNKLFPKVFLDKPIRHVNILEVLYSQSPFIHHYSLTNKSCMILHVLVASLVLELISGAAELQVNSVHFILEFSFF